MDKIICENAEIKQKLCECIGPYKAIACVGDCPICHGAGYTEQDVVKVDEVYKAIVDISEQDEEKPNGVSYVTGFGTAMYELRKWLDKKEWEAKG